MGFPGNFGFLVAKNTCICVTTVSFVGLVFSGIAGGSLASIYCITECRTVFNYLHLPLPSGFKN